MSKTSKYSIIKNLLFPAILITTGIQALNAQKVGLNTNSPMTALHMKGSDDQFLRIQTPNGASEVGVEMVNWSIAFSQDDWKVTNDNGKLKVNRSINNFISDDENILMFDNAGTMGIQTNAALSPIHLGSGSDASNSDNGYLVIGSSGGFNLVLDQNEINARNNGIHSTLRIQQAGGPVVFNQYSSGNMYIGTGGGDLGVGTTSTPAKLSIDGTSFQIGLRNSQSLNDWYIGASNADWAISDNQLIFSPNQASSSSNLRLRGISDNNGSQAPVVIHSSGDQSLLIDGNEFDGLSDPIYINYNSSQNTLINPTGGNVGIGTTSASTSLLVDTEPTEYALRLQYSTNNWNIHPFPAIDKLAFVKDGTTLAQVDGASGAWIALSDQNMKEKIEALPDILDRVNALRLYSYQYKNDFTGKTQFGALAQELEPLFPELVTYSEGQYLVEYAPLAVLALKALQEQQHEIEALRQEILAFASETK